MSTSPHLKVSLGAQAEAVARPLPASARRAERRVRLADRCHEQAVEVHERVVAVVLGKEAVNDIHDAVEGRGGLCDVRRDDDMPDAAWRRPQRVLLLAYRHACSA